MFKPNFTFRWNIWTNFLAFFISCDSVKNEEVKECFAWERFFWQAKEQVTMVDIQITFQFNIDTLRTDPSPRIFISSSWIASSCYIIFNWESKSYFLDGCTFVDVFGISTMLLNWIKSCQTRRWQLASQREWKLLVNFFSWIQYCIFKLKQKAN